LYLLLPVAAIAYFLDPIADYLEELGLKRYMCVAIIMLTAFLFIGFIFFLLVPLLIQQFDGLIANMPTYIEALNNFIRSKFPHIFESDGILVDAFKSLQSSIKDISLTVANSLLGSTLFVINGLFFMFFVPVVTCYLLLDWDNIIATIDDWLPREHQSTIQKIFADINRVLASFVRGQITVCLILGTFYSILLAVVGLNFGLLIGLIAGAVTFIPYLGALLGGALAIGVAFYQFWGDWTMIGAVIAIFVSGQILEGNIITSKISR
jgi:Predicted permease